MRKNMILLLTLLGLLLSGQRAFAWEDGVSHNGYSYALTFNIYGSYTNYEAILTKVTCEKKGTEPYSKVTIPSSTVDYLMFYTVSVIGAEAFKGLTSMTEVSIPYTVSLINERAFQNCTGLTSVYLPANVRTIGSGAFSGCTSLQEITLPSNMSYIASDALKDCSSLHTVAYKSKYPIHITAASFPYLPDDCELRIPYGMEEEYAQQGWTTDIFKGGIVAETIFTIDHIDYRVTGENTVEVYRIKSSQQSVVIPETVNYERQYTVTGVSEGAFENCTQLTSVTLPSTITSVGDRAFAGCSALTAVNVAMTTAPSVTASVFTGVEKANCKLYVPKGAASAYSAWKPYFSTIVDGETFTETVNGVETTFLITGANTVQLGDGAPAISTTFTGAYPIPETVEHDGVTYTVTAIGATAFKDCTGLTGEVQIPTTVKSIGQRAFLGCTGITSAVIPEGIRALPPYLFGDCTSLASVSLPEGLERIFGYAFHYCTSLQTLEIPSSVIGIDQSALYGALTTVVAKMVTPCGLAGNVFRSTSDCKLIVPQGTRDAYINNGWTETVFKGGVVEDGMLSGYTQEGVRFTARVIEGNDVQIFNGDAEGPNGPAVDPATTGSLTFPSSIEYLGQTYYVKEMGRNAFYGCKGITSVVIPEGVTRVAKWAFYQCTALESVTLPSTLTEIGDAAFRECNLQTVMLPAHLTTLGGYAFCLNKNMTTITLPATLTNIGTQVFQATNLLSVIAMGANPSKLEHTGVFWPDHTKINPVILTVPHGTRQRYLDAGYTETQGSTIGEVYKIVEQPEEKNHTFLQVGEGAEITLNYHDDIGESRYHILTPNQASSVRISNQNGVAAGVEGGIPSRIYIDFTPGYTLTKLLRNGRDVTNLYYSETSTDANGIEYLVIELKDVDINQYEKLSMDESNVTWMICIADEESTKPVNPYDTDGDGKITVTDVTKLVNIILGKDHSYEPIDIELDYDVTMKPGATYGEINVPIPQSISNAFALTTAQIAEKTCSTIPVTPERGEIGLYWYTPDEPRRIISYSANTGYWFDASGKPCEWGENALVAAEFNKEKACFVLSQYPNRNQAGDTLEVGLMLFYHNDYDKYAIAGIKFHVTFSDDATGTATLR